MNDLLLGPLLRHVGRTDATVWVETTGPGMVEVLGHSERTWTVAGHHYALVQVTDLPTASVTPYDVRLDGRLVWPEAEDPHPQPVIRTIDPNGPVRLLFGSCRHATASALQDPRYDSDALDAYAGRMMRTPVAEWPQALVLLGDQVYADETSPRVQQRIRARRPIDEPPQEEVCDFEEYTWLYEESWTDPEVRWLLSTLPSSMIFDDHDVRDDWNTSGEWRRDMEATSWWKEKITGGLASYWIYQHLGNLGPQELATDDLYQRVRRHDGDAEPLVREFAEAADREVGGEKGARWSYRRDLVPGVRLLVIDSRCGRMFDDDRAMLSDSEWNWISEQLDGEYDHLLIGTSLPWLLPRALHDIESWDERLASGVRGPRLARWGEKLRRAADLEHWAAFRDSFDRLAAMIAEIGQADRPGQHGHAPATVCVLSGDVHHAYVSQANLGQSVQSKVYQLTCSPLHNYVPTMMKFTFRVAWSRASEHLVRMLLGTISGVPPLTFDWVRLTGPYFGDQIGTLTLDGRDAHLRLEQAGTDADGNPALQPHHVDLRLS